MKRTSLLPVAVTVAAVALAGCGGSEPAAEAYADGETVVLEVQPYGGCGQMVDADGCGPPDVFTVDEAGDDLLEAIAGADLDALVATGPGPCAAAVDGISYEFTVHPPDDAAPVTFDTCAVDLAASDQALADLLLERYGAG